MLLGDEGVPVRTSSFPRPTSERALDELIAGLVLPAMRVDVLNGVNLDVLERRDPALYGGLSLRELEPQIDSWAEELGCTVRCRQTNSEGEYVGFCHDSLDWAEGMIVNPGAWTHYSYAIRDALELFPGPIVEVHLSNPEERGGVAPALRDRRPRGRAGPRTGPDGYREALAFLAAERS